MLGLAKRVQLSSIGRLVLIKWPVCVYIFNLKFIQESVRTTHSSDCYFTEMMISRFPRQVAKQGLTDILKVKVSHSMSISLHFRDSALVQNRESASQNAGNCM